MAAKSGHVHPPQLVRHIVDLLICLLIAVILVRTFQIEGYMISTGSMAPGLLGFHKRVVCPKCDLTFALGVAFDKTVSESDRDLRLSAELCTCPNCSETGIEVSLVPRNQGDQLLVNKGAFFFRNPRRWEVVVFRNPHQPTESYVKRAIGLPGESLLLRDGDVYINDELARKDFETQYAMRIPVFDSAYRPDDPDWESRWIFAPPWTQAASGFRYSPPQDASVENASDAAANSEFAWLTYRHRLRSGGNHLTNLATTPAIVAGFRRYESGSAAFPLAETERIWIDEQSGHLRCRGVIGPAFRKRLLTGSNDPVYVAAIEKLTALSHFAPLADIYGYNGEYGSGNEIRDLMIALDCDAVTSGLLALDVQTGDRTIRISLDATTSTIFVQDLSTRETIATYSVSGSILGQPFLWEVSTFDRQITIAFNGTPIAVPIVLAELKSPQSLTSVPFRIGGKGGPIKLRNVRIYRDVYYTGRQKKHGVRQECRLGPDEYFVLGDNSPVSADSRSWESAGVPSRLLVGKPFLVHLPSRPGKVRLGGPWRYVRIPDFSRVRFVR